MKKYINTFDVHDFTFTYAGSEKPALHHIDLSVNYGEFVTLCGKTGSGKSTLLRNLKTVLAPEGKRDGSIEFYGRNISDVSHDEQARRVGYVLQNPENQIVTDKVWHELAFGLENLGVGTDSIRIRVAEMATFFGISPWINKDISQLSGGQKQILNLAAVMTMNPDVLILDEPTSFLDPMASEEFINTLSRINKEIGTTVIISEHNLNQVIPLSDRVVVMDDGDLLADTVPSNLGDIIANEDEDLIMSLPVPLQIYIGVSGKGGGGQSGPLTVRDGRNWLTSLFEQSDIPKTELKKTHHTQTDCAIHIKDIRFKYSKNSEDVLKNLSADIEKSKVTTLVGGNGAGKSTFLRNIAGLLKAYRGKISTGDSKVILLPQNPQVLFVEDSVSMELYDVVRKDGKDGIEDMYSKSEAIFELMQLEELRDRHPYDLSGGEQQRVAFAKILLAGGDILLLDEPTTGLDGSNKAVLGGVIRKLADDGKTIVMVTHDLDFASEYSDVCQLLFDGRIVSKGTPENFFSGNSFYTTAANRMSRHIFKNAVTPQDVIRLCKDNQEKSCVIERSEVIERS